MAIPATAVSFTAKLDPKEEIDWLIPLGPVLEDGEDATEFTLAVSAEAAALGLTIMTGTRAAALAVDGQSITCWLEIADAYQSNVAFDDPGSSLALDLIFPTNSDPVRTRHRTFVVEVLKQ